MVQHMAEALSREYELAVIGPDGCRASLAEGVRAYEVPHRPLPRFLYASASTAWGEVKRRAPALVVAGSGLTAPLAWIAAKRARCRYVVYLHGLDVVAPSRVYQVAWLPSIRRADLILANSRNTKALAVSRGVPASRIEILHPGTALPACPQDAGRAFRDAHGLGDRQVLLSVGRLTRRKGIAEFIVRSFPAILADRPDTVLLVIGADANDAVHVVRDSELARIEICARAAGVDRSVRVLRPCDDATLSSAYFAADAHIFPVLDTPGDVEGFGMVAVEAAAHGLPTIGFAVGGVSDAVLDGVTGSLVAADDYDGFALRVCEWLAMREQSGPRERCRAAAVAFGWDRFDTQLYAHLQAMSPVSP